MEREWRGLERYTHVGSGEREGEGVGEIHTYVKTGERVEGVGEIHTCG